MSIDLSHSATDAGNDRTRARDVLIRPFRPADQAEARALILAGLGEHFGFIDESRNPDLDDVAAHYLARGSEFFVAELDGRIAGTAGLIFEPESNRGCGRIVRMSVDARYRRRGIAAALIAACKSAAQQRGIRDLFVFTEPHWTDALGLYLSQGFVLVGRDDEDLHLWLALDAATAAQD